VLGNADFFTVADQLGEIGEGDVAALLRVVELSVRVASNDAHARNDGTAAARRERESVGTNGAMT
jgi:hypothetical protein